MDVWAPHGRLRRARRASEGRRRSAALIAVLLAVGLMPTVGAGAEGPAVVEPQRVGKIAFQSDAAGNHDVWIMNGDGSGQRKLNADPARVDKEDGQPRFSEDGTRIVFASCRNDVQPIPCVLGDISKAVGNADIFTMRPDGSEQRQVTSNLAHDGIPDPSPDGRRIAFTSIRNLNTDVYLIDAEGGNERRLTTNAARDHSPSWSPDATRIAFVSERTGNGDIYVMNADGTNPVRLTTNAASDGQPTWSPDGTEIAFVSDRTGNGDIYVMNADGTGQTRLTSSSGADRHPAFAPDGAAIAFSSNRDGNDEIYVMNADGSGQTRITDNPATDTAPTWVEDVAVTASATSVPASPASIPAARVPLVRTSPNTTGTAGDSIRLEGIGLGGDSIRLEGIGLGGDSIRLEAIGLGGDSIPLEAIGLGGDSIRLEAIGLGGDSIRLEGIGLAWLDGLKTVPLSSISLSGSPTWTEVLVGTPFEGRPEHAVSLGELVVAEDKVAPTVHQIPLARFDLTQPPFKGFRADAFLLGRTRWRNITSPLSGGWCPRFEALGFPNCGEAFGGLDGTPLRAQVAGLTFDDPAKPVPLHTVELGDMVLAPDAPVRHLSVSALDLGITSLGLVRTTQLSDPGAVVDCARVSCSGGGVTLHDAASLIPSAVRGTATVAHLGSAASDVTANELLLGLSRLFPFESVPWSSLGIRGWRGDVSSSITYGVRYAPVGIPRANSPRVELRFPASFFFDSATYAVRVGTAPAGAPVALEPEIQQTQTETVLTFQLPDVATGSSVTLSPVMRPGGRLGSARPIVKVSTADGAVNEVRRRTPVVTVTDTFEPNGADTPTPIEPNVLYTSFTLDGDHDFFTLPPQPKGTLVTFLLGGHGADRDLAVWSAEDPIPPLRQPGATPQTMHLAGDDGVSFDNASRLQQTDSVELPALEGMRLVGLSQNREDSSERVSVMSRGGSSPYLVQVAPYNGASSEEPYTLRVRLTRTRDAGSCAPTVFANSDPRAGLTNAPLPSSLPTGTRTLIVYPHERWSARYGAAAANSVLSKLNELAAHPKVSGVVVPIDAAPGVLTAYQRWDANPCAVEEGNSVLRASNDHLDVLFASPGGRTVQNVVLVGDHLMTPMGALPDLTEWGNESTYAASMPYSTANAMNGAAATGHVLSDDPWLDLSPTQVPGSWLYTPDLAGGRLVENTSSVIAAVDAFIASNGVLSPGTALSTATDFMKDLGEEVRRTTERAFGARKTASLIGDGWSYDDLRSALLGSSRKDVVGMQVHSDGHRMLPPANPPRPLSTADIDATGGNVGRIWFSMGCHTGELRPDHLSPGAAGRDWAQTLARRASVFVGQTGYGLGGRHTYDLSEPIVGGFADLLLTKRTDGTTAMTAGQALAVSKLREMAANGVPGVYHAKASQQATLFGLPMYQVGTGSVPAASVGAGFGATGDPAPTLGTDPATGLTFTDVSVTPTHETVATAEGQYLRVAGHAPQVTHHRPVLPRFSRRVTAPGVSARGVTIESYASVDQGPWNPVIAKPLTAAGNGVQQPGSEFSGIEFPGVPARVDHRAGQDTLVAITGAFSGRGHDSSGQVVGRHRRVTSGTWRVWYSNSSDVTPPSWTSFKVTTAGSQAQIAAVVDDNGGPANVARVSALVLDASGLWRHVVLARDAGDPRRFAAQVSYQGPGLEVMGQVLDRAGNSRILSNKGGDFAGLDLPSFGGPRYAVDGPYSPYLGKTVQAGSTVPVKFGISENGVPVVRLSAVSGISSYRVDCATAAPAAGATSVAEDMAGLSVGRDQTYHYNWQTRAQHAGGCTVLAISLDDGSVHPVLFRFKG
ncbi:MAG TPA: PxKF domain-containing protein [Actinomycetota bacterium]|nr:PxKF domain-containing protein [Actinomycetota bacterium]